MESETKQELVKYRLEAANENLQSAKTNLDAGRYRRSLSDSYYAMFTSTRAILACDGVDFKKHTGVISYFQKNYIKTNIIDIKFSDYIRKAFQIRHDADYGDFYIASKADAQKQYDNAYEYYEMICGYLANSG